MSGIGGKSLTGSDHSQTEAGKRHDGPGHTAIRIGRKHTWLIAWEKKAGNERSIGTPIAGRPKIKAHIYGQRSLNFQKEGIGGMFWGGPFLTDPGGDLMLEGKNLRLAHS